MKGAGMSRLTAARERLEKAVGRLESAAEQAATMGGLGPGEQQLSLELAAVRSDYEKLSNAATQVDARLDETIDRIQSALGG